MTKQLGTVQMEWFVVRPSLSSILSILAGILWLSEVCPRASQLVVVRWTKTAQRILSVALATSGIVGVQILTTDRWLWSVAPTHAYGLILFVAADIALIAGMWSNTQHATLGAMLIALVQLVAMLGDVIVGQPNGVPSSSFKEYLLGDRAYLGLLATQGVILITAVGAMATPLVQRHRLALLPRGHD